VGWRFLTVAILAVCGAVQVEAQPSQKPPPGPLSGILAPQSSFQTRAGKCPPISRMFRWMRQILARRSSWDRNWRVGVTADPAAALPDFDDSTWDVRAAKKTSLRTFRMRTTPAGRPQRAK